MEQEKARLEAVREEVIRTTITCLVADDHPAVARAVSDVLRESGIQIAGQVRDGEAALEAIQRKRPNVALLDIHMPRLSGIEVARRCARVAPETSIILYRATASRRCWPTRSMSGFAASSPRTGR